MDELTDILISAHNILNRMRYLDESEYWKKINNILEYITICRENAKISNDINIDEVKHTVDRIITTQPNKKSDRSYCGYL
jgi:hypothetical protein